jgi:hypothetical protein
LDLRGCVVDITTVGSGDLERLPKCSVSGLIERLENAE